LAKHYNAEILENDPIGPYALGGYSFGGLLAYEMARQLIAMDKNVIMLAILDTYSGGRDANETYIDKSIAKATRQFYKIPFIMKSLFKYPKRTLNYHANA